MNPVRIVLLCLFVPLAQMAAFADTNTNVHTTWLWHLHQPIYWPDRRDYGVDHYEQAWDTIQQQNAGRPDPNPEVMSTIFGEADRVNVYQGEIESVLSGLEAYPNAGAQVNYSGALMENVQSLAANGWNGGNGPYTLGWTNSFQTARSWMTSGGKPRLDLVNFTYHHAIAPLVDDQTLEMELLIHQRQMQIYWGTNVPLSRGYFPAETCFSEHIIPILNKVGIAWSVVANNHLARSCADFPLVLGSGGENCDIPNAADQINPPQGATNFQRVSISDGCGPTQVMPFGFQTHYARYVDPNTGIASTIIVVPSDQVFSWQDSYSTWDLGQIAPVAARNNPAHPSLVLCAHDGDNAWGGGYSYYNQWVAEMAADAVNDGYEPTTIEQFLADFPPATNDIIHVEDGGWVFAAGDFGSPSFINWNWPPSYTDANGNNIVNPSVGASEKDDNWRVIIATENRVETAQQISGSTPRIDQVRDPGSFSQTPNAVELGWHYCLGALDSGFVYFGCNGDECLRSIVAQSNACRNVDALIAANPTADTTPPTVFLPQRHPWNPGGTNFGAQYGYKTVVETNSDFWIWTYAYDASGITNMTLLLRANGTNPPTSDQFKTYAGGPLTGAWQSTNMVHRIAPNSNGYTPQYQADYYYAYISGVSNTFVDYYVSATDAHDNTRKTPIQHVWVGVGSGAVAGTGGAETVTVVPNPPAAGNSAAIQYTAGGGPLAGAANVYLHLGWNNWNSVVSPDAAMTFNAASNFWQCTVTPPASATNMNVAFNNGSGKWDNNNGANWNFSVAGTNANVAIPPFALGGAFDYPGYLLASNGLALYAALRGTTLYVATESPGDSGPNDIFIFVSDALLSSPATAAPWAKAGDIAVPGTEPYLAAESTDTYVSWYANNTQTTWPCIKSPGTAGAMEGTLDLAQAFGSVPTNLYLCAAAYVTTNGGPLVAACPAGTTVGPNLNTNNFFAIPVAALRDSLGNGTFDLCDPARGFRILSANLRQTNLVVSCTAMPGRTYQVQFANSLSGPWTNLPATQTYAAPPQMLLSFTNVEPSSTPRYYRVELMP